MIEVSPPDGKLGKFRKKAAVGIPLFAAVYVLTVYSSVTFALLIMVVAVMSLRELHGLTRNYGYRYLIKREQSFVVLGLLVAILVRFASLPLTLAIGLGAIANDTLATLTGMMCGKKLIRSGLSHHSPNKSWEGAIAGVAAGTVVCGYCLGFGWRSLLVGFVASIAGVIGDLQESHMKRDIEIKDVSSSLGSHGGWTDRIDNAVRAYAVGVPLYLLLHLIP